jgi:Ribbon-helix-helix protein, copG family.
VGKGGVNSCRTTITLPKSDKISLERIAKENGVQVSWLIRRAISRLIEQSQGGPLLPLDLK